MQRLLASDVTQEVRNIWEVMQAAEDIVYHMNNGWSLPFYKY